MKFARSAPALLIAAVIVVVATLSIASNLLSRRMTDAFEAGRFDQMGRVVDAMLETAEVKALAGAEQLAAIPEVRAAFAAADRERLLALTAPSFDVLKEKYGISQAQFHTAPATSFLRVHNPAKFGEDLSAYRQIVVEVNRARAIRKGVEITTSGVGIFGTLPMSDAAGQHIGSFEMAVEFGPLLDKLKQDFGMEASVLIERERLRSTATSLKGDALDEQNQVGRYARFYATHPELLRGLVQAADTEAREASSYQRKANGVPYGVLVKPLYSYSGEQIGLLVVSADFSDTRSAEGQAVVWQILMGVIGCIVLAGLIIIVIRGKLLAPLAELNTSMRAVAAGESPESTLQADAVCTELKDLAEFVEAVRKRNEARRQAAPKTGDSR